MEILISDCSSCPFHKYYEETKFSSEGFACNHPKTNEENDQYWSSLREWKSKGHIGLAPKPPERVLVVFKKDEFPINCPLKQHSVNIKINNSSRDTKC